MKNGWSARILNLILCLALAFSVIGGAATGSASADDEDDILSNLNALPEITKGHPKLGSRLDQLVAAYEKGDLSAFAQKSGIDVEGDWTRVVIEAVGGQEDEVMRIAEALGADVETSYKDLVQVGIPVAQVEALADDASVKLVRLPFKPIPSVISEGVSLINADDWHSAGFTGTGVKVGILDGGFSGYDSLLGTELPATVASWWAPSYGNEGTSVHGTACAEIVYDLVPDAQFYLANFDSSVEMGNAVDWLIAQGVDVISCSMDWLPGGPGDGTGLFCQMVDDARAACILWSQAAGNYAQRHWQGDFVDSDMDDIHEFNQSPFDESNAITANSGNDIVVSLKWDDPWGNSGNDYDLLLLDNNSFLVACSCRIQDGNDDPYEFLSYTPTYTGIYHILIAAWGEPEVVNFHLTRTRYNLQYQVAAGSLCVPADSPSAMTMGAVFWDDPTTLESFSSQGPTVDARTKPDLVAPDGVSTSTYGAENFYGTSASAPYGAGAAALVKQRFPSYTPEQIQNYLETNAVALGASGKDNLYGSGRLYLPTPSPALTVTTNAASLVEENSATLNGMVSNDGGEACQYRFGYGTTQGGPYTYTDWSVETKTTGQSFSEAISSLNKGTKYYFRAQAKNSAGTSSGSELSFLTKPDEPTSFTASTASTTQINLSWTKGAGAQKTKIQRKESSYPANRNDGTEVYFGTGTSKSDTGLTPGTTYYYRAWSYVQGSEQWSDNYAQDQATTTSIGAPTVTTNAATSVEETTATLHGAVTDDGGEVCQYQFGYSTTQGGPYTYTGWSVETKTTGQSFSENISGLNKGTKYYFRAQAKNSAGTGSGPELSFLTKPDAPTSFSATTASTTQISLSWTKGAGAQKTKIQRKQGGYPANRDDGTQVYFGTATGKSDTGLVPSTTYYYRGLVLCPRE